MRKLGLLAGLLVLAGCPKHPEVVDAGGLPPGAPKAVAEAEPNDGPKQAQKLVGAVDVTASLHAPAGKKADEDWYAVDPALGHALVKVDPAPPLDVALEVYDSDGVKRMTQDAAVGGGSEVIHGLDTARAVLVRVVGKADGLGGYHLTIAADPDAASEEAEPNNRAADATPLEPGKPVQGYLSDATDEDWLKLSLPAPDGGSDAGALDAGVALDAGIPEAVAPDAGALDAGALDAGAVPLAPTLPPPPPPMLLHLTVSGVPGVRLEVTVVNAAEAPLFSARGKELGDGIEVRNLALRPPEREFYVVVKSAWVGTGKEAKRFASVDKAYTVTAELEQAQGEVELEPNDDAAHATQVTLTGGGASLEGYLTPKTDDDNFLVRSDTPMLARVELSGVEHLDLELDVLSVADGGKDQVVLTANDGEIKEPEVLTNLAVGPGGTYLRIRGAARRGPDGKWSRDSENAQDPYRLTFTAAPDDGTREREPNNAPETATPIQLGQTLRGNIQPRRDADFYRLDLSSLPVKAQLHAVVSGILKVDVALYLYRQGSDGSVALVQTSDTAKGDAAESIRYAADPGVYFLKVKDARDREANFVDAYAIHVETQ